VAAADGKEEGAISTRPFAVVDGEDAEVVVDVVDAEDVEEDDLNNTSGIPPGTVRTSTKPSSRT